MKPENEKLLIEVRDALYGLSRYAGSSQANNATIEDLLYVAGTKVDIVLGSELYSKSEQSANILNAMSERWVFPDTVHEWACGKAKQYHKVILNGQEIDYDAVVALMDNEICEQLHRLGISTDPQVFLDNYCYAHLGKYGTPFEVS